MTPEEMLKRSGYPDPATTEEQALKAAAIAAGLSPVSLSGGLNSGGLNNGLPVSGYLPQSDETVAMVNGNKMLEETILRHLDELLAAPGIDKRWLAVGRTHMEIAWMAINRSIFRPVRAKLDQ